MCARVIAVPPQVARLTPWPGSLFAPGRGALARIMMRPDAHGDAKIVATMRTTVRLDNDVAAEVDRVRRRDGVGLSQAVNQLARQGMAVRRKAPSFRQRTVALGLRLDVSNVADVLEILDERGTR